MEKPDIPDRINETSVGAWFNRDNWQDMLLLFDPAEQPPEGYVRAQPLPDTDYQKYDEESERWVADPRSGDLVQIAACKAELEAIDKATGAGRTIRAIALDTGEKAGMNDDPVDAGFSEDYKRLKEYENRAEELREKIKELGA
jgi:hypothetical protein